MVMFAYINAVKSSALQPLNARAQYIKDHQLDKINVGVIQFREKIITYS